MTSKKLMLRRSPYARILFFASLMFLNPVDAVELRIPWKANFSHNSGKHWSKDNPYDSGFSNNFNNGAPEEFGQVKKDGELKAEIILPKDVSGPIPFMIIMHGCDGMSTAEKEWTSSVAEAMNVEGIGALIVDSYTTRYVDNSCGMPDQHWGRRRVEDSYAALDYLIEHKLAESNEVYLRGYSNGGLATLMSMANAVVISTTLDLRKNQGRFAVSKSAQRLVFKCVATRPKNKKAALGAAF